MLTSLDGENIDGDGLTKLGAIATLGSKLAALPSAPTTTSTANIASKLASLAPPDQSKSSTTTISTGGQQQQRAKLIANTNPLANPSILDAAIVNLDADLKAKILQYQQRAQMQKLSQQATAAKNATIFAQNPPLPLLLDTTTPITFPLDVTSIRISPITTTTTTATTTATTTSSIMKDICTVNGLDNDDQRNIANLIQNEFNQLIQTDMTHAQLDVNILNELKFAREIVSKEEQVLQMEREGMMMAMEQSSSASSSSQIPSHLIPPQPAPITTLNPALATPFVTTDHNTKMGYYDPVNNKFISMSKNDQIDHKNAILRQHALLYSQWLQELAASKPVAGKGGQPQPMTGVPAGKLQTLEKQSQMEFNGYLNKQKQFNTEFNTKWQKSKELYNDYSFFAQFQQNDAKIIENRAEQWTLLHSQLQQQHNDLQKLYYELKNADIELPMD